MRSARPRRRTLLAPEGYGTFAATGSPRCGWRLSRISAPAGRSGRVRQPAFPGSLQALGGAFAPGCPRAGRWGSGPSFEAIVSEPSWLKLATAMSKKSLGHSTSRFNEQFLDEGLSEFDFFGQRPAFFGRPFVDLCFGIEIRASRGAIVRENDADRDSRTCLAARSARRDDSRRDLGRDRAKEAAKMNVKRVPSWTAGGCAKVFKEKVGGDKALSETSGIRHASGEKASETVHGRAGVP